MINTTKILITGGAGKLGKQLLKVFPNAIVPPRAILDITDRHKVFSKIAEIKPDVIIHTAALTSIRECEKNRLLAWQTNVEGTKNITIACVKYVPNSYFVYISTACVFDGKRGMYTEKDLPYPKNYYSLTKFLGEIMVSNLSLPNWLIIRTNFVDRTPWPYPKAFVDRYGTYLFWDELARAIKEVVDKRILGILHIVGDKKLSMYELACLTTPGIQPMTMKEYEGPPLTVDMTLDTIRWKKYSIHS